MKIEIDKNSGFCFGVVYAIENAERELEKNNKLYCLGDIVHNSVEVKRLNDKGLVTIDHEQFKKLKDTKVLIRAHGEPPETYKTALENNIELIDASCPVVLRLQNNVKKGTNIIEKKGGQTVIFGKKGHAEVNGLIGQTNGNGIVVTTEEDLKLIDFTRPVNIFSQTTKSPIKYQEIIDEIKIRLQKNGLDLEENLITNNTICSQVSHRDVELPNFARKHDVIIFVSGKKSSNGKMLYEVCKKANPETHFITDVDELNNKWFQNINSVGICGATSTPNWLMEKISKEINKQNG